ncbi:hypothetical protein, variant 2 [Phialophora macrospora]|uniref:Protein kinase domain-containing protein n=1 Tax=Phialophora macrospora TaxID=1851006 RepID=A0A0D2GG37_9EURO|nr:hypothetical protein PV04_03397 [Phialophora macrospora]KIW71203.1 hypothetical protein, variant 1 [Phialophora macrospora]KIW71204.1 hypothetical protein, variant 2 [Phialophora macrospora]
MPSSLFLEELVRQLAAKREKSISGHYFVTRASLEELLTSQTITRAVAELECLPEDRINLPQTVEHELLVTFAILLWIHQPAAIVKLRRSGHHDRNLPLSEAEADLVPECGAIFYQEQFPFIPHFFRLGGDRDIKPSVILPFIRQVGTIDTGGHGAITKVEIHPSLQDFKPRPDGPVVVIRKTLRQRGSRTHQQTLFENEKRSLKLLHCLKHPNIVPFLGAYVHGQDFCFLFPLIDTDLASFFEQPRRYGDFEHDFTFFSALHGLASAMSQVHDIRLQANADGLDFSGVGYHHDLRPANVLVNSSTFILADFGMGSLKAVEQGSQTPWKAGTGDYLAPECMDEEDFVHQDVGRAIDVWAFGCLIADVATFIQYGNAGLTRFRDSRLSARGQTNWATTYFYNERGYAKEAVLDWLRTLAFKGHNPAISQPLCHLVQDVLTPASERPRIATVAARLANLSVKAHFFAVLDTLTSMLEAPEPAALAGRHSMKIWFERERFRAFGNVLYLYGSDPDAPNPDISEKTQEMCVKAMVQLFRRLPRAEDAAEIPQNAAAPSDNHAGYANKMAHLPSSEIVKSEATTVLEADVQNLTQQLWDLLPEAQLKRVETIWVNSMLEVEDIDVLDRLERALGSERSRIYQEGAAMAMMKRIRLEMAHDPVSRVELKKIEIPFGRVHETEKRYGHQLGTLQRSQDSDETTPVMIECMYYNPNWEKISASERAAVMALKAQGFNVTPVPRSLRILHCLGFYEQPNRYGFVYQAPQPHTRLTTTLNGLLIQSARQATKDPHLNQPFLGDKYHLAHALAETIMEFHSIGWLHENLHSNNVVFFHAESGGSGMMITPDGGTIITQPYVVGLNKSRPGGQAWHTEGPDPSADFQNYQHPDYAVTKHFRNSYDYYSLGLVLLEIGLWTPLMGWKNNPKYIRLTPAAFRDALVETYVPRLGPRMGKVYRDIVKLLLTDGLDNKPTRIPDPDQEREVFNQFFDRVLAPLAALSGGFL